MRLPARIDYLPAPRRHTISHECRIWKWSPAGKKYRWENLTGVYRVYKDWRISLKFRRGFTVRNPNSQRRSIWRVE